MKTLFIIAKKMGKVSDEEILEMEKNDLHPRVSPLEKKLNTQLLDERYMQTVPVLRRYVYKILPMELAMVMEAWFIHKKFDVILSYYERVGLPFAYLQKILGSNVPHVFITTWMSSKEKVWFLKRVHKSLAKILTWSSVQRDFALNTLGVDSDKIKWIKIGTDQKFWRPQEVDKTDMICSAGMEMRDYPTLVAALNTLDIKCHIAVTKEARGQIYDTVKKLYELDDLGSNITIGRKSYTELRGLYARSRFVVVPLLKTDTDNGITVILEAMAMGKPVICSKVEGQVDVIENGKTGIYVPQGDPVALRNAIEDLWNNPEKTIEMGKAARKYVEDIHNLEGFVGAITHEVKKAVSNSKS